MTSIWDQPNRQNFTLSPSVAQTPRPTDPMLNGDTTHGPLLTAAGRGVVDGHPFGVQLQTEMRQQTEQYLYRPAFLSRLRAATRSALGR